MSNKSIACATAVGLLLIMSPEALAAGDDSSGGREESQEDEEAFLTGLDFSYWASKKENLYGPGLSWGLILVPSVLEMQLTVGAMIGEKTYTVPIELRFSVPFELANWLDLFVTAGPTLLFDRIASTWKHDVAASAAAGLEFKPPGMEWGVRVQGDYNLRLVREILHTGGFTIGFLYRF
jgi:hypothetical protein